VELADSSYFCLGPCNQPFSFPFTESSSKQERDETR
jgi:hypothetical protein